MNRRFDLKNIEKISKALGDPYRLKIIEAVNKQNDWTQCCHLMGMFNLAQSTISHHVKQLIDADLLLVEKEGRNTRYLLNKEVFESYINFFKPFKE